MSDELYDILSKMYVKALREEGRPLSEYISALMKVTAIDIYLGCPDVDPGFREVLLADRAGFQDTINAYEASHPKRDQ